ncbi:hypothetical protein ACJZTR_02710 [Neorickettsia risticii]|uniref:Uncharacterized protein n=1 Tax=Neorickettsia risticii (strain Illinois) TaxID=434131 RepID=C6V5D7_NEORI|nr:hypothetical protein [Neorickettsia risticii]ACT69606.1 hypothetical protein NRI_0628 [Neorickettsia risticii str. Illinois]
MLNPNDRGLNPNENEENPVNEQNQGAAEQHEQEGAQQDDPQPPDGEQGAVGGAAAQQNDPQPLDGEQGAVGGAGAPHDDPQPLDGEQGAVGGAGAQPHPEDNPLQELAALLEDRIVLARAYGLFAIICAAGFAYASTPRMRMFFRRHLLRAGPFGGMFPEERIVHREGRLAALREGAVLLLNMPLVMLGILMALCTILKMCIWCLAYLAFDALGLFEGQGGNEPPPPPQGGLDEPRADGVNQEGQNHH